MLLFIALVSGGDWWSSLPVQAESSPRYEEVRARYLKLRNTDIEVKEVNSWRRVVQDLQSFATEFPTDSNAAPALYSAAIALEELHKKSRRDADALKALELLTAITVRYPQSAVADDAMLRASDVLANILGEQKASQSVREKLLRKYPHSDAAAVLKSRRSAGRKAQSAQSAKLLNLPLVMLDPGHGGEDFGAQGDRGWLEKDITLLVAKEVANFLAASGRVRVELTRETDVFVPLAERTRLANEHGAKVFISLHTNASPKQTLQGLQTYFLDVAGDEASRLLAERENQYMQVEIEESDLQFIISDLTQYGKLPASVELAQSLHHTILHQIRPRWKNVKDMGVRQAPFYVLVGAHMPCVLLELLYLDNPQDGALLAQREFRAELAKGISQGIIKFLSDNL